MVYFKEVLPNPAGDDALGEWIKLVNTGESDVDVSGWTIKDAGGKAYILSTTILPRTEIVLGKTVTGISLNNNGETITLIDGSGVVVDTLSYKTASDEEIIVASRFLEAGAPTDSRATTLEDLSLAGRGGRIDSGDISLLVVALGIALTAAFLVGVFVKKGNKNET